MKKWTKVIPAALSFAMVITAPVMAAEADTYTIGYDTNTNGPEDAVQGTNGWYFMYTDEVDKEGKIDVSKTKECVWAKQGSCWFWYGVKEMWLPEEYTVDGYDLQGVSNWWQMDSNGRMDTNTAEGYKTSVIAWEAPSSGVYQIDVEYEGGSAAINWDGQKYYLGDGDVLSISTAAGMVDSAFCPAATKENKDLTTGTLSAEVTLKKGERVYFAEDPLANGESDRMLIKASITKTKNVSDFSLSGTALYALVGGGILLVSVIIAVVIMKKPKKGQ